MKKTLLSLFFIIPLCCFGNSKKEAILLDVQYLPETTYNQTITEDYETVMDISISKELMTLFETTEKEQRRDITQVEMISNIITTGKAASPGSFPVTMKLTDLNNSPDEFSFPEGLLVFGNCFSGKKPEIDSIAMNREYDDEEKKDILKRIQNFTDAVPFPERREVKVGETFTEKRTAQMLASEAGDPDISITTTYKLLKVENGSAYFAIKMTFTANSSSGKNFKIAGKGEGNLVYDISKKYYTDCHTNLTAKMKWNIQGIDINALIKKDFTQTTVIK